MCHKLRRLIGGENGFKTGEIQSLGFMTLDRKTLHPELLKFHDFVSVMGRYSVGYLKYTSIEEPPFLLCLHSNKPKPN